MKKFITLLLLRNAIRLRNQIFGSNHLGTKDNYGDLGLTRSQPVKTINQSKTIILNNPDLIESTIDGLFMGFDGDTTISLTNGQQWRQVDKTVVNYNKNSVDVVSVFIRKQNTVWKMKVDGIDKEITVVRL